MGLLQITIPKPCHEDWALMSPQEKGRFCSKCSKTVVDFSSKSTGEIQLYLNDHVNEKLCGRFRNDQLKKPVQVNISYRSFVNRLSGSQAFIMSLLVAFGTTLFSCTTHIDETISNFQLKDLTEIKTPTADTIATITKGDFYQGEPDKVVSTKDIRLQKRKDFLNNLEDTVIELPVIDVVSSKIQTSIIRTVGLIAFTETGIAELDSIEDSEYLNNNETINNVNNLEETINVYPNPAHDEVNVKFSLPNEKIVAIELYDMNGKFIRTIAQSLEVESGESSIQFDVKELPPATYILRFIKTGKIEIKRIVIM